MNKFIYFFIITAQLTAPISAAAIDFELSDKLNAAKEAQLQEADKSEIENAVKKMRDEYASKENTAEEETEKKAEIEE